MPNYRTIDLAKAGGIHPNTVRKYEKIGFISPVPRGKNGYRIYNKRHLYQVKICRCIFDYGWLGKEIRKASLEIIKASAKWDINMTYKCTHDYLNLIENEYIKAEKTAGILKKWVDINERSCNTRVYSRKDTAKIIGVTQEVLRNWDRNGLIEVPRIGPNNARLYRDYEIERLRIIYMLRQANYSISAILQSLKQYDKGNSEEVINALNEPRDKEYHTLLSVGDKWLSSLKNASEGGKEIVSLINEIKEENL